MSDIASTNRHLLIMRYEHAILIARTQTQGKEIRMMELLEEIDQCKVDIGAQKKVIIEAETNIRLQREELEKEKGKKS